MLERLAAPDGVMAVRVTGQVSEADVAAAIGWMDEALNSHDKVHVFAETEGLTGADPSAIVHGLANGAHLLTRLRRFGRVAVVSEQRWVRAMSRLESAVLPGISYQVFDTPGRKAAFAWVCGSHAAEA